MSRWLYNGEVDQTSPVVLVTGAARRVGAAIVRALHGAGARVAIHHRGSRAEATELAATLNAVRPDSAICLQADLCQSGSAARLIADSVARFGRLDGLVNNASSFFPTPLGRIDEAAWDDLVGSNMKAPLFLSQAAAPALRASRGAIVNITDIHAELPLKNYSLYCAAKAGLLGLTRALALDLAPAVRVNAVAPGPIAWPDSDAFDASARATIVAKTPLAMTGEPSDIARTVRFLLFDAPFVTGQVFNIDGGRSVSI